MGGLSEPDYRVLLAHENEEVLSSVSGFLRERDGSFSVRTATRADQVTEILTEEEIDCVVSGVELENAKGIEFLREVRDEFGRRTPFVLFVDDSGEGAKEAIESGATDYIRTTMDEFVAGVEDPGREQHDILANRVEKIIERERIRTNYREVFNKVNDAVFIENPETGEILDVNERMCEMHGYTREEALDLHVSDVSADEEPFTPEKALESLRKAKAKEKGEGSHVFEWKNETKDGEKFWVEVSLKSSTINGRERMLAVVRDISERKEREKRLQEREERFRRVFEKHSAPMLLIEPDSGEIVNANEAASNLYGYTREELTSVLIDDINQLSDDEVEERRKQAKEGERDRFIFPHKKKDGEVTKVEVNSVPIETDGNSLLFSIIREMGEEQG